MSLVLLMYNLIFLLGFLAYSPVLIWRKLGQKNYRFGLTERTGRVRRYAFDRPVIWIHGVSVGEIKAAGSMIDKLRAERPDLQLLLSTTTPTGHNFASRLYPDLPVIFFPLDFGWFPGQALDRVRPESVLLVELEIWPVFLQAASRRHIPVNVINGRISPKSYWGYSMARILFLPQLHLISKYLVQDDSYRDRLISLGVEPGSVFVTGNLKYDTVMIKTPAADAGGLRSWLAEDGRLVLVGGSTHGEEDVYLARAVKHLMEVEHLRVRLIVAPRHPERSAAVVEALRGQGFSCVRWGDSAGQPIRPLADRDVVVLDVIGQLESFYEACDIAFVGGSLVPRGGQNMLEPAALGKAVLFGPQTENFRADVELLLRAEAAIEVQGPEDLIRRIAELAGDSDLRRALGERALALIRRNQGATALTLQLLDPLL